MARSTNMVIPEVTTEEGIRAFQDKVSVFNEASGGAVLLSYDTALLPAQGGDFSEPVVLARPSGVDTHVDEADPASADTFVNLVQAKGATVRQSRRAGMKYTRDEVMRGKLTPAQYTTALGEFIADYKLKAIRDNLVAAAVAAVDSMDTPSADYHILDVARGAAAGAKVTCTMSYINRLLAKMRDAREGIVTFFMPSAIFADLVGDTISNYKMEKVAGVTFYQDVVQCFGRNVMVADVPALETAVTSSYYTKYNVLGLGVGALQATVVSEDLVDLEAVITTKVKSWNIRQDYDVEYAIQGMKWLVATKNPTDAELATAAKWDEFLSDHRECKIIKGIYNAS